VGKVKSSFNLDDMFLLAQSTPQERRTFISSNFFPIAAAIYNSTDKRVVVGDVKSLTSVKMVTPSGFTVCKLTRADGEFMFTTSMSPDEDLFYTTFLRSKNPNYLRSKLAKGSNHAAFAGLLEAVNLAENLFSQRLRGMVDSGVDKMFGRGLMQRPCFETDNVIASFLADVVMGKTTMLQMPAHLRQDFDTSYSAYEASSVKFDKTIDEFKKLFESGMWALSIRPHGEVVLSAISTEGVNTALDAYKSGSKLPSYTDHNYATYTLNPTWYPSYEAIPEEYRRELDYRLMLLKAHRNSESLIPDSRDAWWFDLSSAKSGNTLILPR
jgi:hypothetical protein